MLLSHIPKTGELTPSAFITGTLGLHAHDLTETCFMCFLQVSRLRYFFTLSVHSDLSWDLQEYSLALLLFLWFLL